MGSTGRLLPFGPIVGGEKNDRIVAKPQVIQPFHDNAKSVIELSDITMVLSNALMFNVRIRLHELLGRLNRQVGLVRPHRNEKGLFFILPCFQPRDGLV